MDIISIGEALIDFTPGQNEGSYIRNAGGAPANFAVGAARIGLDVAFIGRVGNDYFGKYLIKTLEDNHVRILLPEFLRDAVTTLAFVTLTNDGERSFTFVRKPGADILLSMSDIKREEIERCMVLHAGSFSMSANPSREATVYALKLANQLGKMVSFDVNYRDTVWDSKNAALKEVNKILSYVDLLKISTEEIDFVGGADNVFATMREYGISVVIETLGAEGARYYFNGRTGSLIGRKVKVVDATGCGDAFWSGFISRLLLEGVIKKADLTEEKIVSAINYGNISGSYCAQKSGGIPALPSRSEVEYLFNG